MRRPKEIGCRMPHSPRPSPPRLMKISPNWRGNRPAIRCRIISELFCILLAWVLTVVCVAFVSLRSSTVSASRLCYFPNTYCILSRPCITYNKLCRFTLYQKSHIYLTVFLTAITLGDRGVEEPLTREPMRIDRLICNLHIAYKQD
jgi:hypothetical protein